MKSAIGAPAYPRNGNLRMYNMFPYRCYVPGKFGIEGMTSYISEVAAMNYNAIWLNPLQITGTLKFRHPDGKSEASGSLYAMTDDKILNPLIFPVLEENIKSEEEQQRFREAQLKTWTREVRKYEMIPLFDLVLNHIDIDAGANCSLKLKLQQAGDKRHLNLLLPATNTRWPDIQEIDYYKNNLPHGKRGLNAEPKDLDFRKIDALFEALWEPLIRRYIQDYGFMGIRIDAVTHVPVPVQQRAIQLVQKLVQKTYHTDALVVGELMISNTVSYLPALSACGFTHCMNPYSYFWGTNKEGGYYNDDERSPFIKQNKQLPGAIFTPPRHLSDLTGLVFLNENWDRSKKYKEKTIYLFQENKNYYLAINVYETDICFNKALIISIEALKINHLNEDISSYHEFNSSIQAAGKALGNLTTDGKPRAQSKEEKQQFIKELENLKTRQQIVLKRIFSALKESKLLQEKFSHPETTIQCGGLIGLVGNHDVGTLKAKIMLDIAYNRALENANNNHDEIKNIETTYNQFKQATIKGIRNTDELMKHLQNAFRLNELEKKHLYLELNMRMREKIFIQSMACVGGWYSLAGDEFGICHKPEVFREFAESSHVGSSLIARRDSFYQYHDFRGFIGSINLLLKKMPASSYLDKTSLHYDVLSNEIFGEKPADILFMVLRYNALTQKYYLMGHCNEKINPEVLLEKIGKVLVNIPNCKVHITDSNGSIDSFYYTENSLSKVFPKSHSPDTPNRFFASKSLEVSKFGPRVNVGKIYLTMVEPLKVDVNKIFINNAAFMKQGDFKPLLRDLKQLTKKYHADKQHGRQKQPGIYELLGLIEKISQPKDEQAQEEILAILGSVDNSSPDRRRPAACPRDPGNLSKTKIY